MRLYDHIYVKAPPWSVWEVLSDPNLMESWNPKCLRCHAGNGPFGVGSVYEATFRLGGGPERLAICMIEEYQCNKLLTTKYSGPAFKMGGYVKETYRLMPKGKGTKVKHVVDFDHSGLPITIQLIAKIIHTVGYSVGKGPLDGVKELVEKNRCHRKCNTPTFSDQ